MDKIAKGLVVLFVVIGLVLMLGFVVENYIMTKGEAFYEAYLRTFPAGEVGKAWSVMNTLELETTSGTCFMDYRGTITLDKIRSDEELILHYTPSPYGKHANECSAGTEVKSSTRLFRRFIAKHGGTPG